MLSRSPVPALGDGTLYLHHVPSQHGLTEACPRARPVPTAPSSHAVSCLLHFHPDWQTAFPIQLTSKRSRASSPPSPGTVDGVSSIVEGDRQHAITVPRML